MIAQPLSSKARVLQDTTITDHKWIAHRADIVAPKSPYHNLGADACDIPERDTHNGFASFKARLCHSIHLRHTGSSL
jgi:hypothetical protein